jgi:hypothetical protein
MKQVIGYIKSALSHDPAIDAWRESDDDRTERDRFTVAPCKLVGLPDIAALPEHECWLLAHAHVGPHTRAARLALAALRSRGTAPKEARDWLASVTDGEAARHAKTILGLV